LDSWRANYGWGDANNVRNAMEGLEALAFRSLARGRGGPTKFAFASLDGLVGLRRIWRRCVIRIGRYGVAVRTMPIRTFWGPVARFLGLNDLARLVNKGALAFVHGTFWLYNAALPATGCARTGFYSTFRSHNRTHTARNRTFWTRNRALRFGF
jgi:hypothetical protein